MLILCLQVQEDKEKASVGGGDVKPASSSSEAPSAQPQGAESTEVKMQKEEEPVGVASVDEVAKVKVSKYTITQYYN